MESILSARNALRKYDITHSSAPDIRPDHADKILLGTGEGIDHSIKQSQAAQSCIQIEVGEGELVHSVYSRHP